MSTVHATETPRAEAPHIPAHSEAVVAAAHDIYLTVMNDGDVYRRFLQPLVTGSPVRVGTTVILPEHLLQTHPSPETMRAMRVWIGEAIDAGVRPAFRDRGTWSAARQLATTDILEQYVQHAHECREDPSARPAPAVPAQPAEPATPAPTFAASRATFGVDDGIRDLLGRCTITEDSVTIPGQLPRATYEQLNKVLTAAGGRWNRSRQAHVFTRDPREVLASAIDAGKAVNVQKHYQAYYTPPEIAELLVRRARLAEYTEPRVLEPSCGDGRLLEAIARHAPPGTRVRAYEIDPVAAAAARQRALPNVQVTEQDFLTLPADHDVDVIVMNPPFTRGQDIVHVTRALDHLAPGGHLVAVMSTSWQHATGAKPTAFRNLVERLQADVEVLPAGTFASSGTEVATTMLTYHAPRVAQPTPTPVQHQAEVVAPRCAPVAPVVQRQLTIFDA